MGAGPSPSASVRLCTHSGYTRARETQVAGAFASGTLGTRRRCATVARHLTAVRSGFKRWERRAERPSLLLYPASWLGIRVVNGGGGIRTLEGPKRPLAIFETARIWLNDAP